MATIGEALGVALQHHQSGELQQAEQLYRRILDAQPDQPDALHLLGVVAHQTGRNQAALQSISRAIAINPNSPQMYNNVAHVQEALGERQQAAESYRRAIVLDPGYLDAHYNLGNLLRELGRWAEAATSYERALDIDPYHALALNNLGDVRRLQGRMQEAVACFRSAVKVKPDFVEALCNLGAGLRDEGNLSEAVDVCQNVIEKNPRFADAHGNLALAMRDQGKLDEALLAFREALRLEPENSSRHSQMLLCLNHHPAATSEMLLAEHLKWAERHGATSDTNSPLKKCATADLSSSAASESLQNTAGQASSGTREPLVAEVARLGPGKPTSSEVGYGTISTETRRSSIEPPNGPLRIGYVSPNLCRHVVASFMEPILEHHDPDAIETFCYADVDKPDDVTARMQQHAGHWRDVLSLDDRQLADTIRKDRIDILIDLAGHTTGHRLGLFAKKPAPIQVSYLGYPNTTGLATIDYRLTDAVADVPKESQWHTEKLMTLPQGFLCYGPPGDGGPVMPPPMVENGFVTFGSLNRLMKLNADVVRLWAEILWAAADSKLLLKAMALDDAAVRTYWIDRFEQQGIAAERLLLFGHVTTSAAHLATYHRIDIALDPFPYNGTGTTCESLWMGVPVITLAGDRHAGRVGASLLERIGMRELIADSPDSYVRIAAELAGDPCRLARLRSDQRHRMARSPLCDAGRFTRSLEQAYRSMWHERHR